MIVILELHHQQILQLLAPNLAHILVTNLQILSPLICNLDNPTLIVVLKQPLPTETIASL